LPVAGHVDIDESDIRLHLERKLDRLLGIAG